MDFDDGIFDRMDSDEVYYYCFGAMLLNVTLRKWQKYFGECF